MVDAKKDAKKISRNKGKREKKKIEKCKRTNSRNRKAVSTVYLSLLTSS